MHSLYHIIYQSAEVAPLTTAELARLLEQSRYHNLRAQVTGLLLYDGNRFFQVLEGSEEAVSTIFGRIRLDCRHTGVEVLAHGPLARRQFAAWSMALIDDLSDSPDEAAQTGPLQNLTDAGLWLLIQEFWTSARQAVVARPGGSGQ